MNPRKWRKEKKCYDQFSLETVQDKDYTFTNKKISVIICRLISREYHCWSRRWFQHFFQSLAIIVPSWYSGWILKIHKNKSVMCARKDTNDFKKSQFYTMEFKIKLNIFTFHTNHMVSSIISNVFDDDCNQ